MISKLKNEIAGSTAIGSPISSLHNQLISSMRQTVAVLLVCAAGSLFLPVAAAQSGFISIDCGSASNYTDSSTGLLWSTDDEFIATGFNRNVTGAAVPNSQTENAQQLSTARYFPLSRRKNCYILPAQVNSSYLIRASFLYGNLESSPPAGYSFNLSIDSNMVDNVSVSSTRTNDAQYSENFVVAASSQIAVCVIPIVGTPFISALELRPLDSGMYSAALFNSKYIKSLFRYNCGAAANAPTVRYPDDAYDRLWTSPGDKFKITSINTTSSPDVMAADRPPVKVLQSAWQGTFWFNLVLNAAGTTTFYVALYVAEISTYNATADLRVMEVFLNGVSLYSGFYVRNTAEEISKPADQIFTNNANFSVQPIVLSTLPGILNGFEMHEVYDSDTTTTASMEVSALDDLRQSLNLLVWTGDPCLPVPWDWLNCSNSNPPTVTQLKLSGYQLSGTIPASISSLTYLTDLWLDDNNITGSIPNLANLTYLKTLHLQNNSLTGIIPASLAEIPNLSELYLGNNKLSGPVPTALLSKNGLDLRLDSYLLPNATSPSASPQVQSSPPPPPPPPSKSSGISGAVIGGVIGAVAILIGLLLVGILFFLWRRRKNRVMSPSQTESEPKNNGPYVNLETSRSFAAVGGASGHLQMTRAFSRAEVREATNNFKIKVGEGGFGPVYYGKLKTGEEVAVKRNVGASGQSLHEFSTEVSLLSRVHHRNLVSLLGFCEEGGEQILIYEYMQNGTLRDQLYGKGLTKMVDWRTRLDIALNAARGLEYLHNDCNPKIIHRDVKSNNILLNEKLFAKVADFGISKQTLDEDNTNGVSTEVRGTTGYFDPEYFSTNKITYKSDVYAFGVVLLEIISGRPPNDAKLPNLVDYGRRALRDGNLEPLVDPHLSGTYNVESMWKLAELAVCCVEPLSMNRPGMIQVVRELMETMDLEYARQPAPKIAAFASLQSFNTLLDDDVGTPSQPSYPTTPSSRPDTPSSTQAYFTSARDTQSTQSTQSTCPPSGDFPYWSEPRAR